MVTATADEVKCYTNIVPDLRAVEARVRAVSRVDAEAIEKIIAERLFVFCEVRIYFFKPEFR